MFFKTIIIFITAPQAMPLILVPEEGFGSSMAGLILQLEQGHWYLLITFTLYTKILDMNLKRPRGLQPNSKSLSFSQSVSYFQTIILSQFQREVHNSTLSVSQFLSPSKSQSFSVKQFQSFQFRSVSFS